jgi:UTP-glucose-1-phosphate uridylyltransferase
MDKTKPTLLILAAGLGSRYGSLKQIDRIGPSGERIIDYSVYDAVKAGFGKIVYVIRESFKEEFKEVILDVLPRDLETEIVCQEIDSVPSKISYSKKRSKPWGTAHALLTAASIINEPFAVINADDFYGAESFKIAANFLVPNKNNSMYALIGYKMKNTLSEFGSVSRGVCEVNADNYLSSIVERTEIKVLDNKIIFKDDNNAWNSLAGDEVVSMNMFGFNPSIFNYFDEYFQKFLEENKENLNAEYFLPSVVDNLIATKKANVKILETPASWFGLTYPEDKPIAIKRIADLVEKEIYPPRLWV